MLVYVSDCDQMYVRGPEEVVIVLEYERVRLAFRRTERELLLLVGEVVM